MFFSSVQYVVKFLTGRQRPQALSRLTENKHWATDLLAGAALGYLGGRQVVNNYHRYAKLRAPGKWRHSLSYSLGYGQGQLIPSLVYRF